MKRKNQNHMNELTTAETCEFAGGRLWPYFDFIEALANYQIGEDLFFYNRVPVDRK
jgi:hypothetical protein